jgi:hypothetical protein
MGTADKVITIEGIALSTILANGFECRHPLMSLNNEKTHQLGGGRLRGDR